MASSRSTKRHRSGHPLKAGPAEVLVEASAQNTHSNVDVGKHNDETDPTGLPTAALAQRPAGDAAPRLASAVAGAPPLAAAEPEDAPPLKRHRTARAKIPAALPPDALRVTDRLSGPVWADSNEGHYMYNVGDNLTPRCEFMATLRGNEICHVIFHSTQPPPWHFLPGSIIFFATLLTASFSSLGPMPLQSK